MKSSRLRLLGRVVLIVVALLAVVLGVAYFLADRPLPEGRPGPEADAMARRMMAAIDHSAWQGTGAVTWNFGGRQQHLWDRDRQLARVRFGDAEVLLDLTTREGIARRGGETVEGEEARRLLDEAWSHWCNDSFWLNPVSKVFDEGTRRSLVTLEGGEQALLVEYTSGGVTPGDAYLWRVDENHRPVSWRMWTRILPLGGIEASWEDWRTLDTGVQVSGRHHILVVDLVLSELAAAEDVRRLTDGKDPFADLVARSDEGGPI
jgi:hypothetical protein